VEGGAVLERHIDLPRSIVWDALVDPVLVEGWLDPAARLVDGDLRERIEPAPGEVAVLATVLEPFGELRFELRERDGGTRGTTTMLRLMAPSLVGWSDRVDDLENLLRGHPVEWAERGREQRRAPG
jgi:hypothetical protein